jgi:hypothetical protein
MYRDDFASPKPYSVVLWRHAPGDDWAPAFVTGVYERTISCTVFARDFPQGMTKDGVRFVDDPIAPHVDPYDGGGYWDYTEDQKLLRAATGEDGAPRTALRAAAVP